MISSEDCYNSGVTDGVEAVATTTTTTTTTSRTSSLRSTPRATTPGNVSPVLIANKELLEKHQASLFGNESPIESFSLSKQQECSSELVEMIHIPLSPPMHSISPINHAKINNDVDGTVEKDELLGIHSMQGYTFSAGREVLYWLLCIFTLGLIYLIYHWFPLFQLNLRRRKTPTMHKSTVILVYVLLWMAEEYYVYACAIFVIASVSSILSLKEIRSNLMSLKKMSTYSCDVLVLRDGTFRTVSSSSLVPGDIIDVNQGLVLPCDMSLLSGQAICNESMLTGESIPVTKHPLMSADEIARRHSDNDRIVDITQTRSSMFGGTVVVKTQAPPNVRVLAMVREIGFQTSKGKLILSILFPKKSHFKFVSESLKFVGVLCCVAVVGFAITAWRLYTLGVETKTIVLRALDLITIVVPPALPMAMTVGTGFALIRLRHQKIFCISPPRLNMAGKIQVFCFDKTGTLTEEGLDFYGVLNLQTETKIFSDLLRSVDVVNDRILKMIMASCHSLTMINDEVSGDPLEIKIFQATQSVLTETPDNTIITYPADTNHPAESLTFVERFDFQSALQRMSVIVRTEKNERFSFVKGSPEMIKKLSIIDTEQGYRVLACAYRVWDQPVLANREQVRAAAEDNLVFVGFIIMENKLKPESRDIISTLHKANIKTIMVTGDNPLTALSVSKQCGIVKQDAILFTPNLDPSKDIINWDNISGVDRGTFHKLDPYTLTLDGEEHNSYSLIITGPTFKRLHNSYLQTGSQNFIQMLRRGLVYARMSPDDKQTLIEELQRVGMYVGMCGDGANDCGALKAAHVGISLSETEASIAAPFTSTVTNISCCPSLIKEGRASLAVSFKLFQFMGMYSLIQFTTVIFLYFIGSVLVGMTRPSNKLSTKRPSGRLISGMIVGSLIAHIAVCIAFQTFVFFLLRRQSWYDEVTRDEENIFTYVTTSLFSYGNFQYLIMALSFSFGKPFLKPLYTNLWDFLQLLIMPIHWRFTLLGIIVANLFANLLIEFVFIYYKLRSKKKKMFYYDQIFSKEAPKDSRITEESILLPVRSAQIQS
eukprot:gene4361-5094_t